MDKLKNYLLTVAMNKYLPMGAMAAVAALGTFMTAHAGILEKYGVTFGTWPFIWQPGQEPSGHCILIELDTLSTGAIAGIISGVTIIMTVIQHHTTPVPQKPTEVSK